MWSQSVDVARWVRPAIEHAQDVLSGGLGQEGEYDFVLVFKGSCFVLNFLLYYLFVFFLFGWLCPFLKNQIVGWFFFLVSTTSRKARDESSVVSDKTFSVVIWIPKKNP